MVPTKRVRGALETHSEHAVQGALEGKGGALSIIDENGTSGLRQLALACKQTLSYQQDWAPQAAFGCEHAATGRGMFAQHRIRITELRLPLAEPKGLESRAENSSFHLVAQIRYRK